MHYSQLLQREKLTFNDFSLSPQEQETVQLFLKTTDIKSYSSEILKKEILKNIYLKLQSLKYSESFENEYSELQKIGLIR